MSVDQDRCISRRGIHNTFKFFAYLTVSLWTLFASASSAVENLVMGVHPYRPHNELKQMFQPLAEYLTMKLGRKVEVRIGDSYQSHHDAILAGEVDFAYIGPSLYVRVTHSNSEIPVLACLEVDGKPTFTGKIIVSDKSGLKNLEDLKQRQFAFGNKSSTMSHLLPRQLLYEAGVDLDDLAGYRYYSNHNNVAMAVLAGDADAGAVKEAVYEKYKKHGIVAIETTEEIPEHLFIGTLKTDSQLLSSLRDALLSLNHENSSTLSVLKPIKQTATALVRAGYRDYEVLREILDSLSQRGVEW